MTREEFKTLANQQIICLDGATGTNLQKAGMPTGVCPEQWILEHKDVMLKLQTEYVKAGTQILYAPTFTCNRLKLKEYGLESKIVEMNQQLVELSKQAACEAIKQDVNQEIKQDVIQDANQEIRQDANQLVSLASSGLDGQKVWIAGDITMTGEQLYPIGTLLFEELVEIYKEQIQILVKAGVDLLVVETMMSLQECRACVIAAKEVCELPIMVTLTYAEDGRTLFGTDPITALVVLENLGADAVGINCSTGPDAMLSLIKDMKPYANIPLIAKPNAGMPKLDENGQTIYDMEADAFAVHMTELVKAGVSIIGGCCGTTPEYIRKMKEAVKKQYPMPINASITRVLTSERKTVEISLDGSFMIVGERINPTGKKVLQAELREGKMELVCDMALEQEEKGATILDINMGMNGIDEKEMMQKAIYEVSRSVNLPLCIDSSHVDVIEAALRIYPGRALINSISLEKEKIEKLLPIAKKYGAMFILLPLSEQGLPESFDEKIKMIHQIMEHAFACGLSKDDMIVDGLVATIGANKKAALETLETIRYVREELEIATITGLSNISFGLPDRNTVNTAFLTMAIQAGLTMAICNPSQDMLVKAAYASDMLLSKKGSDIRYIHKIASMPKNEQTEKKEEVAKTGQSTKTAQSANSASIAGKEEKEQISEKETKPRVYEDVLKGNRGIIVEHTKELLNEGFSASAIMNEMLIPAINEVGRLFDKKIYFLPQLIQAAEAMKTSIEYLEPLLIKNNANQDLPVVVIATVQGDIHDIGKNLVALMLKNYGYRVIDLGKDVPKEVIVETAKRENAAIIALSALMTTTMREMKYVVDYAKEQGCHAKVIIGGAVITESFAQEIHANGYSKDAAEAVRLVDRLVVGV